MGAYIREDLVRTEMGAYIHGVPILMGCLLSRFYGIYIGKCFASEAGKSSVI